MLDAKHVTTEDLKSFNTQTSNTDPHSVAAVFQYLVDVNATYRVKIHNTYNTWEEHVKAGYPPKNYSTLIKHHFRNFRHDTSRAIKPLATGTYPAYRELNGFMRVNLSTLERSALNRRGGRFKEDWENYEKQLANLLPELLNLERKNTARERT